MENRPRYFFSHQVMRNVVFKAGDSLKELVLNRRSRFEYMIEESWKFANKMFNEAYIPYDLEMDVRELDDRRVIVLFSCPLPKEMLDTYMCGFVTGGSITRYFTVEKGMERTILGEWTKSGGRLNYGEVSSRNDEVIRRIEEIYTDVDPEGCFLKVK